MASLNSRRRVRALTLVPVLLFAAACRVDNTPTSYSDQVQANFEQACQGAVPTDAGTAPTLAPPATCTCLYRIIVASVPFDDAARDNEPYQQYPRDKPTFATLESDLKTDPTKVNELPSSVTAQFAGCGR